MNEKLLGPKSGNINNQLEDLATDIQNIQKNNDRLQREIDEEILSKEIVQLYTNQDQLQQTTRNNLNQLDQRLKDMEHKNKLKRLKVAMTKEIDRFSRIQEEYETKQQETNTQSNVKNSKPQFHIQKYHTEDDQVVQRDQIQVQQQNSTFQGNVMMDNMILKQNEDDINYIEENAHILQKLTADIAMEVHKQDMPLDVIQFNQAKTKDNVYAAENELMQATQYQKSSTKCYLWLFFIVLIVAVALIVVLLRNKIFH